jgi:tetratricopeptide (TPR) repeat protein
MWKRDNEQSSARTALVRSWDALVAPPPRAHGYIARPNIDEQIATILDHDARVALVGVSGCGKTQIAAYYLSDSVDRYTFRWWVRGTSRETLENDLEAIGSYVGVYGSSGEPVASVARRVVHALQEVPAWLMVIDDVKDPAATTDLLPQTGGHVIVTTQNAGWFGYGRVLAIPPFDLDESRSLLRSAPTLQSIPDETLDEISTLYAGLPLAIAQATSYLATTGVPIEQYRTLLGERRAELLARGNAGSHPTLAASISLTLAKLSLNARQLLEMLSNLAPSAFELVSTEDDIGGLLTDPLIIEDSLAELRSFSLVEREGQSVVAHELVQDLVRSFTTESRETLALYRAYISVTSQLPWRTGQASAWPIMERVLPHSLVLIQRLETAAVIPSTAAAFLLNRIAPYFQARGQPAYSEELLQKALLLVDAASEGDTHDARGSILTNLGNIQYERGDLATAESTLREAIALKEATVHRDDRLTGISYAGLAVVLEAKGDVSEARRLQERALELYRPSGDAALIGDCLIDLARLAVKDNARDEALKLIQEAIEVTAGKEVAWSEASGAHMVLANLYEEAGDVPRAVRTAKQAVTIARDAAPESRELAKAMATQGRLLASLGIFSYGIRLLEKGLAMFERLESPDLVEAATMRGNLGLAYLQSGDAGVAYPLLKKSEEQISQLLPATHETTIRAKGLLAECLEALGQFVEAQQLLESTAADADKSPLLPVIQRGLDRLNEFIAARRGQSGG